MMITACLATRNRPRILQRMIESLFATSSLNNSVICRVDQDDDETIQKIRFLSLKYPIHPIIMPPYSPHNINRSINECVAKSETDIIMYINDDFVFGSDNWDQCVIDAFEEYDDKILLVCGDDKFNGDTATHGFLHKNWINCLGYALPEFFLGDYADAWITKIAKGINRFVRLDCIFEHMHWSINDEYGVPKGTFDEIAQRKTQNDYNNNGHPPPQHVFEANKDKINNEMIKLKKRINDDHGV